MLEAAYFPESWPLFWFFSFFINVGSGSETLVRLIIWVVITFLEMDDFFQYRTLTFREHVNTFTFVFCIWEVNFAVCSSLQFLNNLTTEMDVEPLYSIVIYALVY